MIESAKFWVEKRIQIMTYDPNAFGGGNTTK